MNTTSLPLKCRKEKEKAAMEQVVICSRVTEPATIKLFRMCRGIWVLVNTCT